MAVVENGRGPVPSGDMKVVSLVLVSGTETGADVGGRTWRSPSQVVPILDSIYSTCHRVCTFVGSLTQAPNAPNLALGCIERIPPVWRRTFNGITWDHRGYINPPNTPPKTH